MSSLNRKILLALICLWTLTLFWLSACDPNNTATLTDAEKTAMAIDLVERYVRAWNEMDLDRILSLYAGHASIEVPGAGNFDPAGYRVYLDDLFAPLQLTDALETDRDIWLSGSRTADVKFRFWALLRSADDEFYASKTWLTWRLSLSSDREWKIAWEKGEDKIVVQDQLLGLLPAWIAGWEALNPEVILSFYSDDAVIFDEEGEQYSVAEYRTLLAERFQNLSAAAMGYSLFQLDWLTWAQADVSFQVQLVEYDTDSSSTSHLYNLNWELVPFEDSWLIHRQTMPGGPGDDDTTDDDVVDDDVTDDDSTDDDVTDDDVVDDDAVDDDVVDDDSAC